MSAAKRSNWHKSDRRSRLPSNWESLRKVVGRRDGWQCQQVLPHGGRCLAAGNQVDHIVPSGSDDPSNLQVLCARHHRIKSSREGGIARHQKMLEVKSVLKRPPAPKAEEYGAPGVPRKHRGF